MKIHPSLAAHRHLPAPGPAQASSPRSFKSFLPPESANNTRGAERAFSFTERGVLNTGGPAKGANSRDRRAPPSTIVEEASSPEAAYVATAETPRFEAAIKSVGQRLADMVGKAAQFEAGTKASLKNAALSAGVAPRSPTDNSRARAIGISRGVSSGPSRPLPTHPASSTSGPNVTLFFEAHGAVQVTIALPVMTARQSESLRKAVSEIVDEFGMELSELRLNGSLVEPFSKDMKGGPNGHQPR